MGMFIPFAQAILTISYHDGRSKQFFWSGSFNTEDEAARACDNWLHNLQRDPNFTDEGTLDIDCSDNLLPTIVKFFRRSSRPIRIYDHTAGKYLPYQRQ